MEEAVPALFGNPLLIRVSLHYRFTAIVVEPQVASINDGLFDVLYIGTGTYNITLIYLTHSLHHDILRSL